MRMASSAAAAAVQATEDGVDARDQLAHGERLGHVVVGAGVEAADLVGLLPARGQHDDRHERGRGAHLLAHRKPLMSGSIRSRITISAPRPRSSFTPSRPWPVAETSKLLELERVAQAAHDVGLVLDDEDAPPIGWR